MNKKDLTAKIINGIFGIFTIVMMVVILWFHNDYVDDGFSFDEANVFEWNDSWEVNVNGTVIHDVSLPVNLPAKSGEGIILLNTLPDKIKEYNCIMLEGRRQDIQVGIGGIQRETYTNNAYRRWGKTTPSGIVLVPLLNTDSNADVAIHISSDSVFAGSIGKIYLGNEKSLVVMLVRKNIPSVFITAIVFITGIVCLVCYFIYSRDFKQGRAMHYLAIFAFLSSMWSFANSGLRQLFISDLTTLEAIGFWGYMLLPIPFIMYADCITDGRYKKWINGATLIAMINFILENVLMIVARVGFYEMRFVSYGLLIASIVCVIVLCCCELKSDKGNGIKNLLIGAIGFLIGVTGEILYNNFGGRTEEHIMYISGALIFLAAGFVNISLGINKEQKQRKDAESANKAKSEFLANMSHEILTPINAIVGMNEMIARDSSEDVIREYSANISTAGKSLLSLVNKVFDFSKIEAGQMEIVHEEYEMRSVLRDLITSTQASIGNKGINLVLDIDASIPSTYYGDSVRIKQVLSQLLSNAVKYTDRGDITFTVKNRSINENEINLLFSVKDTGHGISKDNIERFKEAFVRIENVKNSNIEGTGLGLAIVTELLELMGSRLEIVSAEGEGSEFFFIITQRIVNEQPMGQVNITAEQPEKKKKKITFTAPEVRVLAVDDNRMNLKVLTGVLKSTQMKIETCESGKDCLELCRDNHYDLIFMDHMMPEMDGIETFKRLRADKNLKSNDSTVFVLTANTVSGAEQMYMECGFDQYLKKPIDVSVLNKVLLSYIPKEKCIQ